jgi:gliding motility-associated-like protein
MKLWHKLLLSLIFLVTDFTLANAAINNLGFETGTFTGWTGYTWLYSTEVPTINTSKVAGIINRRHTIISDTTAYDSNTGNALKKIPSGYKYSCRLGDVIATGDVNPRCWEQSLQYKLTVDDSNSLLIMKFACVLQYASDHTALMEPRFKLTLYDASGNTINTCTNYDVYSTSGSVKGFNTYTPSGSTNPVKWRDWTTVGADLSAYKGQTVTIEFMSADCTGRYHYGYAYFIADYQPMKISTDFCGSSDTAKLTAPTGFESYKWRDMNSLKIVNTDTTLSTLSVPMLNKDSVIYHCIMRSATGCIDSLSTTILKYKPTASFSSKMVGNCTDDNVQFTNNSSTNRGTMNYLWDYGDGTTDTISTKTHIHHYTTSGHHSVKLTTYNPPSTCSIDTVKDVESIDVDLVGLKVAKDSICIGSATSELIANGAWTYKWSIDSTATVLDTMSIKKGLPAKTYWVIGYNSTYNCYSKKHFATISNESNWQDSISGNRFFCKNDSTKLYASSWYLNAANKSGNAKDSMIYLWSTEASSDTITIKKAGTYSLTAIDKWGCSRIDSATVVEKPLPLVEMNVTPTSINTKYNSVVCSINQETNVTYLWDYGDSTLTDIGSAPARHYYIPTGASNHFTITLTATNTSTGCINSNSEAVMMEPFVPNVFSPNLDGHNDRFMPYYQQEIYDRFGVLLYQGDKNNAGWDGTYKGMKTDSDTYFYIICYTDFNNQARTKKGYITLVR